MKHPLITPYWESFEKHYYKSRIRSGIGISFGTDFKDILEDGTIVYYQYNSYRDVYIVSRFYPESYFKTVHFFHANGNILCKKVMTQYGNMSLGKTYRFDENGDLTNIIDEEEGYHFGFNQFIMLLRREGMDMPYDSAEAAQIEASMSREIVDGVPCYWASMLCSPKGYPHMMIRHLRISGKNGEILEDTYSNPPIE